MTQTPDPQHTPDPHGRSTVLLDGDAAIDLLIANTGPGNTVLDFDQDSVLRAAAQTTGRRYLAGSTLSPRPAREADPGSRADLVVLAWPRPQGGHPEASREALADAADALAVGGHVAVLLDPTVPQAYAVTWTGAVLAAARAAGLDYLQDVVCLHNVLEQTVEGDRDLAAASSLQQHRVVLVLRSQAGRHA